MEREDGRGCGRGHGHGHGLGHIDGLGATLVVNLDKEEKRQAEVW